MTDLAVVPNIGFYLFALHVVQAKEVIILDDKGVHLMEGRLFCPRSKAGSRVNGTRIPLEQDVVQRFSFSLTSETPIAAAFFFPWLHEEA